MSRSTDAVVAKQRKIQSTQDARDARAPPSGKNKSPVQTGARDHPGEYPAQHLLKPGLEARVAAKAAVRGARLPRQRQAAGHGGADHRRRLRHRPRGGGAVRARRRRRGDRLSRGRAAGRRGDQALRRGRRPALPADSRRREATRRSASDAVEETVAEFGKLDILVNNAAFQEHAESIEDITDERLDETLRTNIYGYFQMARAAVPHLQRGGSIINTGSVTGLEGSAHLLDYATTKGAIHAFTKSLAQQPARQGHPRQRGRAGAGVDAAQPGRRAGRRGGASSASTPT